MPVTSDVMALSEARVALTSKLSNTLSRIDEVQFCLAVVIHQLQSVKAKWWITTAKKAALGDEIKERTASLMLFRSSSDVVLETVTSLRDHPVNVKMVDMCLSVLNSNADSTLRFLDNQYPELGLPTGRENRLMDGLEQCYKCRVRPVIFGDQAHD